MGATNGIIAFGVPCEEGTEFPWDEFEGDITEWWRHINGYRDIYEPYTPEGHYAPGWSGDDPRLRAYYDHASNWLMEHPVPVSVENYCSHGSPMYAICVAGLGLTCRRGYPETFDPTALVVTPEQIAALKAFMQKYGIAGEGEPRWLLMSYKG